MVKIAYLTNIYIEYVTFLKTDFQNIHLNNGSESNHKRPETDGSLFPCVIYNEIFEQYII